MSLASLLYLQDNYRYLFEALIDDFYFVFAKEVCTALSSFITRYYGGHIPLLFLLELGKKEGFVPPKKEPSSQYFMLQ